MLFWQWLRNGYQAETPVPGDLDLCIDLQRGSANIRRLIGQVMKQYYWVVQNKFLAGAYPRNLDDESSQAKINALVGLVVSAFFDLTEESDPLGPCSHLLEAYEPGGISYQRFPLKDVSFRTPRKPPWRSWIPLMIA